MQVPRGWADIELSEECANHYREGPRFEISRSVSLRQDSPNWKLEDRMFTTSMTSRRCLSIRP